MKPGFNLFVQLKVYPNPANTHLNIRLNEKPYTGELKLVNTLGHATILYAENGFCILPKLNNGFYILSITKNNAVVNEKIIISNN